MRLNKLKSALLLTTICSMGALFVGGCADNNTTLFVSGNAGFAPDSKCELEASLTVDQNPHGRFDTGALVDYRAWLIVGNGLQPLGDNDTLRPETSRILIEGANITITDANQAPVVPEFFQQFSASIQPDESEDPGVAIIPVPMIPAGLPLTPGEYVVNVEIVGETLGGTKVESNIFKYPVKVVPPGSFRVCGDPDGVDEATFHPCGKYLAQDGYGFSCFGVDTDYCNSCP